MDDIQSRAVNAFIIVASAFERCYHLSPVDVTYQYPMQDEILSSFAWKIFLREWRDAPEN